MSLSSYPKIELTMAQEVTVRSVELTLPKLPREVLETQLIEVIRQRFAYENAFKEELKRSLG
jgi:hypothetical protein